MEKRPEELPLVDATTDRRAFLATCGRFAVITPPAVTMLLSTSLSSEAIAKSGGKPGKPGRPGKPGKPGKKPH